MNCAHCDSKVWAKGLCNMHYKRVRKFGDPFQRSSRYFIDECIACGKPHKAMEFCGTCYQAFKRSGQEIETFKQFRISVLKHTRTYVSK